MRISEMKFILRKFKESDLASLVKYANNYNIAKFLTNMFPHPYTEENGKDYLSLAINHPGIFAIDVDGEVVGSIGLFPQTDIHQKSAELGYWLAEPFWGNGIVPQAIGEIVEYGFKILILCAYTHVRSQPIKHRSGYWRKPASHARHDIERLCIKTVSLWTSWFM